MNHDVFDGIVRVANLAGEKFDLKGNTIAIEGVQTDMSSIAFTVRVGEDRSFIRVPLDFLCGDQFSDVMHQAYNGVLEVLKMKYQLLPTPETYADFTAEEITVLAEAFKIISSGIYLIEVLGTHLDLSDEYLKELLAKVNRYLGD